MFIDSHCHLDRIDLTPYQGSFDNFVSAANHHGISGMLCIAIDLEAYPAMLELVRPYAHINVSVGVHPNVKEGWEPTVEELVALGGEGKVLAIGETGLDYYRIGCAVTDQQQRFRNHIRAAKILGKPLIIHTREAQADTLRILAEEGAADVGGIIHCFTEDWAFAERALDLNFYISFSGIITFNNTQAIKEVAKKVPHDRYLIETDAPYLAPVPHRGKPNYPLYVRHVADCIAQLRCVSSEEIAMQSRKNFHSLFTLAG